MNRLLIFLSLIALIGCGEAQQQSTASPDYIYAPDNLSDSALFRLVQERYFEYFWEGSEPISGLGRERLHMDNIYPENDKHVVTSGGAGFGVMAIIVGMERGFISREQGRRQLEKIVGFMERADKFHGAFPHWWNGETGKVKPFGYDDDGGDLVETSYMMQGLLCVRQYFNKGSKDEQKLAARIDTLWRNVEYDWYTNGKKALYWHWSPKYEWKKNFAVKGYNECLILYILAASSPTHSVPKEVYYGGWADSGRIRGRHIYKNDTLHLRHQGPVPHGGPLFWAHYSFLGLDPRGLKDEYADYWKELTTQTKINYQWCVDNPKQFKGYGPDSWGLTASYSYKKYDPNSKFDIGYEAHAPDSAHDLGVISPTAALSSFPYMPNEAMAAMKHWYNDTTLRRKIWGHYGFYDAFSETNGWFPVRYLAIDQGPVVVMMENYRSGLLWKLFMSCPEIKEGLKKLGYQSPWLVDSQQPAIASPQPDIK
jgi:hypothetical protein